MWESQGLACFVVETKNIGLPPAPHKTTQEMMIIKIFSLLLHPSNTQYSSLWTTITYYSESLHKNHTFHWEHGRLRWSEWNGICLVFVPDIHCSKPYIKGSVFMLSLGIFFLGTVRGRIDWFSCWPLNLRIISFWEGNPAFSWIINICLYLIKYLSSREATAV